MCIHIWWRQIFSAIYGSRWSYRKLRWLINMVNLWGWFVWSWSCKRVNLHRINAIELLKVWYCNIIQKHIGVGKSSHSKLSKNWKDPSRCLTKWVWSSKYFYIHEVKTCMVQAVMWYQRRTMRISGQRENQSFHLPSYNTLNNMVSTIWLEGIFKFFGHISKQDQLEKLVVLGSIYGNKNMLNKKWQSKGCY